MLSLCIAVCLPHHTLSHYPLCTRLAFIIRLLETNVTLAPTSMSLLTPPFSLPTGSSLHRLTFKAPMHLSATCCVLALAPTASRSVMVHIPQSTCIIVPRLPRPSSHLRRSALTPLLCSQVSLSTAHPLIKPLSDSILPLQLRRTAPMLMPHFFETTTCSILSLLSSLLLPLCLAYPHRTVSNRY